MQVAHNMPKNSWVHVDFIKPWIFEVRPSMLKPSIFEIQSSDEALPDLRC